MSRVAVKVQVARVRRVAVKPREFRENGFKRGQVRIDSGFDHLPICGLDPVVFGAHGDHLRGQGPLPQNGVELVTHERHGA